MHVFIAATTAVPGDQEQGLVSFGSAATTALSGDQEHGLVSFAGAATLDCPGDRMAPSLSFLRNTKSCSIVQETKGSRSFASFTCRRTSMSVTRTDVAHVPNWQRAAEATNLLTLQICMSLSGRKLRAQLFSSSKPTTRHWRCSTSGPLQRMTSPGFFNVGRKRIHRSALCWKPWGGCYSRP